MMEPISIRYRLTESEFMKACNAHWSSQRLSPLSNLIWGAIGIGMGLMMLYLIFWLGIMLCVVGSLLLLFTAIRSFLWRRAFREAKKYNRDISLILKEDSIHVENAEGKSDLNWDFFTWYLDTPESILLYMTQSNFSVIPKSAFQEEQEVPRFLDLVKRKLKRIR